MLKRCLGVLVALGFCMSFSIDAAEQHIQSEHPSEFIEGQHYTVLPLAAKERLLELYPNLAEGEVRIFEFFSYACVWCFRAEPSFSVLEQTEALKKVTVERIPIIFQASWRELARAYYTAEALGVLDRIHEKLFQVIHEHGFDWEAPGQLRTFFLEQGVDADAFDGVFQSFSIDHQLRWSESIAQIFKISRIPSVAILTKEEAYLAAVSVLGGGDRLIEWVKEMTSKHTLGAVNSE